MGIESDIVILAKAMKELGASIESANASPAVLLRLQKKILSAKARLAAVEDEYKKAKASAIEKGKREADLVVAEYKKATESMPHLSEVLDIYGATTDLKRHVVDFAFHTAKRRAEQQATRYSRVCVQFTEEANNEAKAIIEEAADRADKMFMQHLIAKAASQPVTGDAPEQ